MSRTTIKALWPGEKHADLKELRNSHGSAPVVWDEISQKYLGTEPFAYSRDIDKLWPLWKDESIPLHQRAVLTMTYDNVYVAKADYAQAAKDIRAFLIDFPEKPGYSNHWNTIAEIFESNPDIPAIGFHWTSVCCDPFEGSWNEEKEDFDPFDWSITWDMYKELRGEN
jgi:hypothetical protein